MLERYTHIRMAAKREALAGIRLHVQAQTATLDSEVAPVKVPEVDTRSTIQ